MKRPLYEIAEEALADETLKGNARAWSKPYLEALTTCSVATDQYLFEDAHTQVLYALSNLSSWRGDSARRIKTELKAHI